MKDHEERTVTATISYHLITFAVLIPKIPWRCKSLIQISSFSFYLFFLKISISPQMAFFSSFSVIITRVFPVTQKTSFMMKYKNSPYIKPRVSNKSRRRNQGTTLFFFFYSDHIFEHMVTEGQYSRVFSLVLLSSS